MSRPHTASRTSGLLVLALLSAAAHATEPCQTIHGRAHLYGGDGQLRIWHIGTHHEFEPDRSSWQLVLSWLNAGVTEPQRATLAEPASAVYLFGDFDLCPSQPFRKGAVQPASFLRVRHKHYTAVP